MRRESRKVEHAYFGGKHLWPFVRRVSTLRGSVSYCPPVAKFLCAIKCRLILPTSTDCGCGVCQVEISQGCWEIDRTVGGRKSRDGKIGKLRWPHANTIKFNLGSLFRCAGSGVVRQATLGSSRSSEDIIRMPRHHSKGSLPIFTGNGEC